MRCLGVNRAGRIGKEQLVIGGRYFEDQAVTNYLEAILREFNRHDVKMATNSVQRPMSSMIRLIQHRDPCKATTYLANAVEVAYKLFLGTYKFFAREQTASSIARHASCRYTIGTFLTLVQASFWMMYFSAIKREAGIFLVNYSLESLSLLIKSKDILVRRLWWSQRVRQSY